MSRYEPNVSAHFENLDDVQSWMKTELLKIQAALAVPEPDYIQMQVLHAAPGKTFDGMVVGADGTDWDPGSGRGIYEFRSGTGWVKVG